MNAPSPIEIDKNEVELVTSSESLDEYAALAEKAGFFAEDIVLYQLRAYLRSAGLSEYPLEDVETFLNKKFGKAKTTVAGSRAYPPVKYTTEFKWGWHPLRAADAHSVSGVQIGDTYTVKKFGDDFYDSGRHGSYQCEWSRRVLTQPYNRLIPFPVLKTVAEITARFPTVSFIVADWVDHKTTTIVPSSQPEDPFLALLGPGIPLMIIERWDEPNFR